MPTPRRNRRDRTNERLLRPVHPNAGITAEYRRKLDDLIGEMNRSVLYWLAAKYRANEPRLIALGEDETPADALQRAMSELTKRWLKRFDEAAPKLADWFAKSTAKRSQAALRKIMKDAGFTVEWKMTPAARDVMDATINAQVSLIKSIPQHYLAQVEGMVMRSVQTGRDLGQLTDDIEREFGVTRRRAAFIALDQNNKATASMTRARQLEVGVTEAIWVHSGGGKEQRRTHLKAGRDRQRYEVAEGWYDPDVKKFILPGELPNCRCVARAVVPGFS